MQRCLPRNVYNTPPSSPISGAKRTLPRPEAPSSKKSTLNPTRTKKLKKEESNLSVRKAAQVLLGIAKQDSLNKKLFKEVQEGSVETVKALLQEGASVEARTSNGFTPLHLAIFCQKEEIALLLIEKSSKEQVQLTDKKKETPLHICALKNAVKVAEVLLKKGAEPSCKDTVGTTPLHIACFNGYKELAALLLDSKANAEVLDRRGNNALFFSVIQGHTHISEMFTQRGYRRYRGSIPSSASSLKSPKFQQLIAQIPPEELPYNIAVPLKTKV